MTGVGRDHEVLETFVAGMDAAVHDMCQPLTALRCRLEVAQMNETADRQAAAVGPSGVVWTDGLWTECLRECHRLSASVVAMRALLERAQVGSQKRIG